MKVLKKIFIALMLIVATQSFACHNSSINSVSVVDNGDGTRTYTIDVSIDVGSNDGYSTGFALLFSGASGTPLVTNLITTSIKTNTIYQNLIGHYGSSIGNTYPIVGVNDFFETRYGNRNDVVTFETPDADFGAGSTDYNNRTVVVTLSGCVQTITLDADFRTLGTVTSSTQCVKTFSIPNVDTNCNLDVKDNTWEGFSIYPNPASTFLTISNSEAIDTIEVFNAVGQTVLQQKNREVPCNLDITDIPNGFYTIKVSSGNKQKMSRFIKQ